MAGLYFVKKRAKPNLISIFLGSDKKLVFSNVANKHVPLRINDQCRTIVYLFAGGFKNIPGSLLRGIGPQ